MLTAEETAKEIVNDEQMGLISSKPLDLKKMFLEGANVNNVLEEIRTRAYKEGQDITTDEGRETIRTTAYKISRSKTFLDNAGKEVVSDAKKLVDAATGVRKKIKTYLDDLKTEYRKPLTDWEDEQKKIEEQKAKEAQEKMEGRVEALSQYRCVLPFQSVAVMTDEEFETILAGEKANFEEQERKANEAAEAQKAADEAADKARKEEADRLAKQKEEQEKKEKELKTQKDEIEKTRKDIWIKWMIDLGFKYYPEQDRFEYGTLSIYWKNISLYSHDEFIGFIDDLKLEIKKIKEQKEQEAKAEIIPEVSQTASLPDQTEDEIKVGNFDLFKIETWLNTIRSTIEDLAPTNLENPLANTLVVEIESVLTEFIKKCLDRVNKVLESEYIK